MFRIWAKVIKDGKIIKQTVYEKDSKFAYGHFFDYLADICEQLDMATPILIKRHIINYAKFNMVKFMPSDFAESVDFDRFVLENVVVK